METQTLRGSRSLTKNKRSQILITLEVAGDKKFELSRHDTLISEKITHMRNHDEPVRSAREVVKLFGTLTHDATPTAQPQQSGGKKVKPDNREGNKFFFFFPSFHSMLFHSDKKSLFRSLVRQLSMPWSFFGYITRGREREREHI